MKFRFKFETVLKVRKSKEDDALRALGAAQRAYQAELVRKQQLLFELEAALKRREELGNRPVGIQAFHLEQNFITGTKQRITRQDQAILRASKGVEKALRGYLAARKQTRTIEILREKAFAEFKREQAKKEQKRQDDLTIMRAAHRAGWSALAEETAS